MKEEEREEAEGSRQEAPSSWVCLEEEVRVEDDRDDDEVEVGASFTGNEPGGGGVLPREGLADEESFAGALLSSSSHRDRFIVV